jgi:ribosomal protein L37AE/L43A
MPVKPSEREEEYFARLEVERRKQALAEQQPPADVEATQHQEAVTALHCPKCGASLVARHYKGIEIDKCSRCQGIWLDNGELERMLPEVQGLLRALRRIFT